MILTILGLSTLIALLQNFDVYHRLLLKYDLDTKPFNCALCSGFWYSVGFTTSLYGWKGILASGIIAVLAEMIDRKLNDF